jgi:hypothetical protein
VLAAIAADAVVDVAGAVVAAGVVLAPGWLVELEQAASESAAVSTPALIPARRTGVIRIRIVDHPDLFNSAFTTSPAKTLQLHAGCQESREIG